MMSRDDDVLKTLGGWLGKAKKIADPPKPSEAAGVLAQPERPSPQRGDDLTQLNFKIPQSTKRRIKQLAVRDNITLLVMLDRMLELYEREYGKLGK
jgi:hypothetical protein